MDEYQLFKSLIKVLTPVKTYNELSTRLKGKLEPEDIAFTIFEMTKICAFCQDTRKFEKSNCPVCTGKSENYLWFYFKRLDRYRLILREIPDIWERAVIHPEEKDAIE